jgi:iron complex outermembrane receptor protein
VGGVQDQSGEQLPYSPKWNANLTASYGRALTGDLRLSFDVNYSYRSSAPINTPDDPSTRQDGFPLVNMAIGVGPESGHWRVSAFGRNLTDEAFETRRFNTPFVGGVGAYSRYVPYEARRIYGISFEVRN